MNRRARMADPTCEPDGHRSSPLRFADRFIKAHPAVRAVVDRRMVLGHLPGCATQPCIANRASRQSDQRKGDGERNRVQHNQDQDVREKRKARKADTGAQAKAGGDEKYPLRPAFQAVPNRVHCIRFYPAAGIAALSYEATLVGRDKAFEMKLRPRMRQRFST